jgi:hypothetical protein
VKFRSPGTLGTKKKKKRKKKKSSSQSLRGCSRSSVRTRWFRSPICYYPHYLCIPTDTHPSYPTSNRTPQNSYLMSKHMLICPNQARGLILADRYSGIRSRIPKILTTKTHCNSSSPTLWFLLLFTSLLLNRLAIAVNYRGQNRYEIPSHASFIHRCNGHRPGSQHKVGDMHAPFLLKHQYIA